MSTAEKEFVIQRAATAGQITVSSAVFGRGTDFFCKDETVETNGGVHVVQAFLSAELSEEIQIQGRSARQGKKGTYSMVLLEKDLEQDFEVNPGPVDNWPRNDYYKLLSEARKKCHDEHCKMMELNLKEATDKDKASQDYLDALLRRDPGTSGLFKNLYLSMKKRPVPETIDLDLTFAIDNTGSMRAYKNAIRSTISSLVKGHNSFLPKLKVKFPDTTFKIRLGLFAYRDIDDGSNQFRLATQPFTEDIDVLLSDVHQLTSHASGGGDISEDHLGAIHFLTELDRPGCWESSIKVLLLLTDAPCHGHLPSCFCPTADNYNVRHPMGLTVESVADDLIKKEIDLFICSLNPMATLPFEKELASAYFDHKDNSEERMVVSVPLVQNHQNAANTIGVSLTGSSKHIVFVLDESGSMSFNWSGVVVAYNNYMKRRLEQQFDLDLVSVVQFDSGAHVTVQMENIVNAPDALGYSGGGTRFHPAAHEAYNLVLQTPASHSPVVVFMSDGMADDSSAAASTFNSLNQEVKNRYGGELELHVIGFGGGTDTAQLRTIASASGRGSLHSTSDVSSLSNVFVQIAGGGDNVAKVLETEIGNRIYDAVTDRLTAEYVG